MEIRDELRTSRTRRRRCTGILSMWCGYSSCSFFTSFRTFRGICMSTEPNPALREGKPVEPRRLLFGTASGAVAWVLLGMADIVITWRACMVQEDYGIPTPRPDIRILYF